MRIEEFRNKFRALFENKLEPNEAKEFLIELYKKGETIEEIAEAAKIMREFSIKLETPFRDELIDIVGTGGDKSNSFNISSTVALLISSAGSIVAKHGNRSITSKSGSADMLEALGINLNLNTNQQLEMLEKVGFTFIFAVNHHPAMKHIMPIRRAIPHRTIFNILGPLTNPAQPKKYLLGVFSKDYINKIANALKLIDTKKALVVSSEDKMDEISPETITYAKLLENNKIKDLKIDPKDYKIYGKKENLIGKDAKENARITRAILSGELKDDKREAVLLNSAAALFVDNKVSSIEEGIELSKELIDSKKAIKHLDKIIQLSRSYDRS